MRLLVGSDPPAVLGDTSLILNGAHVRLVPLRLEHAVQVQPWVDAGEEGLACNMASPVDFAGSAEAFISWVLERAGAGNLPFAVERLDDGALVGMTRFLHIDTRARSAHVGGTWYVPPARGTVVNPECKLLLLRHAFDGAGLNRIQIQTNVTNIRSQRAITRIGATFEGINRANYLLRDDTVRDTWVASIIRTEWPDVRAKLSKLLDGAPTTPAYVGAAPEP